MAKIKVTKFNFSPELLEQVKKADPLFGALAEIAEEKLKDIDKVGQMPIWIDTDKVVAVSEVIKAKEDKGHPDTYQVFFAISDQPQKWQITADSYGEFMQAWKGE